MTGKLSTLFWLRVFSTAGRVYARPTWLELAHKHLDAAVFSAHGWKNDLSDEEILEKLLVLNLESGK